MKEKILRYIFTICAFLFLFLFVGCSNGSRDKTNDIITSPQIPNSVQYENSDAAGTHTVEVDNMESETPIFPEKNPLPSIDGDSPLEIEVEIKQPWEDGVDVDIKEDTSDDESDHTADAEDGTPNQDSNDSDQDIPTDDKSEHEKDSNEDFEIENIPTSSPSGDNKPDFSLEIE